MNTYDIIPKKCGCGELHWSVPKSAPAMDSEKINGKYVMGGMFLDCRCSTTLFVPWDHLKVDCFECMDAESASGESCSACCPHDYDGLYCMECGNARDGSHNLNKC